MQTDIKQKPIFYISNSFLEDRILENGEIENRTLIKIGPLKTDKNKKKQRTVFY